MTYIGKHELLAVIHVVYHGDPLTDPHILLWVFDQQEFLWKEERKDFVCSYVKFVFVMHRNIGSYNAVKHSIMICVIIMKHKVYFI